MLQTFATTQSDMMKRRVAQFLTSSDCPACHGKRLRPEALSVKFAGLDIADISRLPLKGLNALLQSFLGDHKVSATHPEKTIVIRRIVEDLLARLSVLLDLGLGYLTLERSTPTLFAKPSRTSIDELGAAIAPGDAPIGHRQPRADQVPSEKNPMDDPNDSISRENAELDRMTKGICRGC